MARQKIPKVTPIMLKTQPSQFSEIVNRIIDAVNENISL